MSTQLVKQETNGLALNEIMSLGDVFKNSGYFRDVKDQAQAVVKILYGRELGFSPVVSMMGIHVIEGKPALSSNLMGAMVKRSGKYNYKVKTLTDKECDLEFSEDGALSGHSFFTMDDAQKAGVVRPGSGWTKYPRNMLFARALSNGVKLYCPELSACPIYVPEELGAEVNEEGAVTTLPKSARAIEVIDKDIEIGKSQGQPEPTEESPLERKLKESLEMLGAKPEPIANGYIDEDDAKAIYMHARSFLDKSLHKFCREWVHEWAKAKGLVDIKGDGTLLKIKRVYINAEGKEESGIMRAKNALAEVMKDRNIAALDAKAQ